MKTFFQKSLDAIPPTMTQYNIPQTAQTTLNSPAIPQNIQLQTLQQPQKIRNSLNQIQIIQNATPAFPNMTQILNQQKLNKTPMPLLMLLMCLK
jgi:hypothetical protein